MLEEELSRKRKGDEERRRRHVYRNVSGSICCLPNYF
jgi:hypothetical protein